MNYLKSLKTHRILAALIFTTVGLIYLYFDSPLFSENLTRDPLKFFEVDYVISLTPMIVYSILLISGLVLLFNFSGSNFFLAFFGHTVLEDILFNIIRLTNSTLSKNAMLVLGFLAVLALFVAYSNYFKLNKLSVGDAIYSFILGTLIICLPVFN